MSSLQSVCSTGICDHQFKSSSVQNPYSEQLYIKTINKTEQNKIKKNSNKIQVRQMKESKEKKRDKRNN